MYRGPQSRCRSRSQEDISSSGPEGCGEQQGRAKETSRSDSAWAAAGESARLGEPGGEITSLRWARWLGGGSLQPPIPGSGTPSPRNRRRAILRAGRVCFNSALQWWLLDSCESSPFATLSRGAFSASSLVTPIRADTSRNHVVPVCNTDSSLPTPPHTASRRAPLFSFFAGFSHDSTYDQTPTSLRAYSQRPASSGPAPSLQASQNQGQSQERNSPPEGGHPA
jgi:hypothetical protein